MQPQKKEKKNFAKLKGDKYFKLRKKNREIINEISQHNFAQKFIYLNKLFHEIV